MATMVLTRPLHTAAEGPFDEEYEHGQSSEAKTVGNNYKTALLHYLFPVSLQKTSFMRFYMLFDTWKYATISLSSPTAIAMHPAYQEIIGMGDEALPLILKELAKENDYWFWALKSISGEDPVSPEDRGDMEKMRLAWLDWGMYHGYLR